MIWNTIFTHLEMLLNTVSENIWSIRRGPWRDNLDVASTPLKIKRNLRNKQFTASLWILSGKKIGFGEEFLCTIVLVCLVTLVG